MKAVGGNEAKGDGSEVEVLEEDDGEGGDVAWVGAEAAVGKNAAEGAVRQADA